MSLPSLASFFVFDANTDVLHIHVEPETVHVVVQVQPTRASCPICGHTATRRHSRYARHVQDLPIMERAVTVLVVLNKWHCDERSCPRRVFSDRLDWLPASARYTLRLEKLIRQIAFSHSCLAAERLCREMHIPISHDALLVRIKKEPEPPPAGSPFRGHR
jgi:transposase